MAGWSEAWCDLYRREFTSMVRVAKRVVRSTAVAEELVQDVFIRFASAEDRCDPECRRRYITVAVLNAARSSVRQQAHRNLELERQASSAPSPEQIVIDRYDLDLLKEQLTDLTERQRQVIMLRYFADRSESEIARELCISQGSVKTHASRGIGALRMELNAADSAVHTSRLAPLSR